MRVYWLEQREEEVPAANDWLCVSEIARLNSLRFVKRRADWRLGRWTAKRSVAAFFSWPAYGQVLERIEIRAKPSGAPEAAVHGRETPVVISLSHRAGTAMCVVSSAGLKLGCDLEVIEPRSDAFLTDYFTPEERSLVAKTVPADRPTLLTLLWSAKESALKALGQGLRLDTRSVVVSPTEKSPDVSGWSPLSVRYEDGQISQGWWRIKDDLVRTVVADLTLECPASLADGESPLLAADIIGAPLGTDMKREAFSMAHS